MILTRENGYKAKVEAPDDVKEAFCEVSYHAGNVNMLKSIVAAVEACEEIDRDRLLEDLKSIGKLL